MKISTRREETEDLSGGLGGERKAKGQETEQYTERTPGNERGGI